MLGTTIYRNQPGISNKFIAQVGYFLTAMVAAVETIAALVFSTLAFALLLFSKKIFEHSTKWLSSSAFSFAWSFVYFTLNFFYTKIGC